MNCASTVILIHTGYLVLPSCLVLVLPGATWWYLVLPGAAWCYLVLPIWSYRCYMVVTVAWSQLVSYLFTLGPGTTWFYFVLPGAAWVLLVANWSYLVPPGHTADTSSVFLG